MRTVVFQSFRAHDVPGWMSRCMQSVREWAAARGHDYRFYGDELFERAPAWYRERTAHDKLLVSDLARAVLARELLADCELAIWMDADLLVFDPQRLRVEAPAGYAFCREAWIGREKGAPFEAERVNNAVSAYARGNSFLPFYIDAMQAVVRQKPKLSSLDAGTTLLTGLRRNVPLPLLNDIGTLSPWLLQELATGGDADLRRYAALMRVPIRAANLCGSSRGRALEGLEMTDAVFDRAVALLLETRGDAVNRLLPASQPA
jgi:hypothetical protein